MSLKQSKDAETSYKIAPIERMITRHRSAQFRRQLRKRDENVTNISPLLIKSQVKSVLSKSNQGMVKDIKSNRSPIKSKKMKIQASNNGVLHFEKSVNEIEEMLTVPNTKEIDGKKEIITENEEYYPNNLKRRNQFKKMFLKPQHQLKYVGDMKTVNKRKLYIPQKDCVKPFSSSDCELNSYTSFDEISQEPICKCRSGTQNTQHMECSMVELIRITEDSQSLTDEDFLEILTCPSPVWWEEPSDLQYTEDPIFSKKSFSQKTSIDGTPIKNETKKVEEIDLDPSNNESNKQTEANQQSSVISKLDSKSVSKYKKLENLLGHIKCKIFNTKSSPNCHDDALRNDDLLKSKDVDEKLVQNKCSLPDVKNIEGRLTEDNEDEDFSELILHDDKILRHLENMNIPIEDPKEIVRNDHVQELGNKIDLT